MNTHDDSADNTLPPQRRRRSFLATRREEPIEAETQPMTSEDDDIPVLTEVVPLEEADSRILIADEPPPVACDTLDARLEELATQMAQAIGQQMTYELPTLIEATLLNAGDDLRTGITATMEAALRDFIARRKQLQLPLDDAASG